MDEAEFKRRTMAVSLATLRLCDELPHSAGAQAIGRQLVRSATSVGANYRAACRTQSLKDRIFKLGIVEEEADESMYWYELLAGAGYAAPDTVRPIRDEMNEVLAMVVASRRTLRSRLQTTRSPAANRTIEQSSNRAIRSGDRP